MSSVYGRTLALTSSGDLTRAMATWTGAQAIIPAAVNVLLVSPGDLPHAPTLGVGLDALVNSLVSVEDLQSIQSRAVRMLQRDPRVAEARVSVQLSGDDVYVDVNLVAANGENVSFSVVKSVSSPDFSVSYLDGVSK